MKRIFTLLVLTFLLTGCATVKGWVPSFWDDNQSYAIIDVRLQVEKLDCAKPHLPQVQPIADFVKRSEEKQGSETYCEIKKKLLQTQAKSAAQAILGRF